MSLSLRSRVVILIISIIIFLTAIVSILISIRASEDLKAEIGTNLSNTAYQMTDRLDQYMWGRAGEVRMLRELAEFKNLKNQTEMTRLLNKIKENYPAFAWIGVANLQGTVIASTDGVLTGQSIAKRPVFVEGIKDEFIGDVHDAVLLAKSR